MITKLEQPETPVCEDCANARAKMRQHYWAGYKGPAVPKARFDINGRKLCARHAGTVALNILLEGSNDSSSNS